MSRMQVYEKKLEEKLLLTVSTTLITKNSQPAILKWKAYKNDKYSFDWVQFLSWNFSITKNSIVYLVHKRYRTLSGKKS